jgi:hypothetical protein
VTSLVRTITFDCADPETVGRFWAAVTGRDLDVDHDEPDAMIAGADGQPHLLFLPVPEGKTVKNRVHLDLQPTDRGRDEEVERLLGLGARLHSDHRRPDGTGFVVLADPEDNELCVERSATERGGG